MSTEPATSVAVPGTVDPGAGSALLHRWPSAHGLGAATFLLLDVALGLGCIALSYVD